MNQKNRQCVEGGLRHIDSFYMITPAIFNCIPVDGFELFNHLSNKEGRKTRTVWPPPRAGLAPPPPITPASAVAMESAPTSHIHTRQRDREQDRSK